MNVHPVSKFMRWALVSKRQRSRFPRSADAAGFSDPDGLGGRFTAFQRQNVPAGAVIFVIAAASRLELIREGPARVCAARTRTGRATVGQLSFSDGDVLRGCMASSEARIPHCAKGRPALLRAPVNCRSPIRTAAAVRRENQRKWRGPAHHRGISTSDSPMPSPKTPRNRGIFPA